jgi:hypothetical protein
VPAALSELVTVAVRDRTDELRAIVRQEVDRALAALVSELVDGELEQRRNGHVSHVEDDATAHDRSAPTAVAQMKTCTRCGRERPASEFLPARSRCRSCRAAEQREKRARRRERPRDEPEPTRPRARMRRRGVLVSRRDVERQEETRRVISAAPVELVERDGRVWTVRRLPGGERHGDGPVTVGLRSPRRGVAIA